MIERNFFFSANRDFTLVWRHEIDPQEPDWAYCGYEVDEQEDRGSAPLSECESCVWARARRIMDQARADVAVELGVDESEVF